MNRTVLVAAGAVAIACVTAGAVILLGNRSHSGAEPTAAPASSAAASPASVSRQEPQPATAVTPSPIAPPPAATSTSSTRPGLRVEVPTLPPASQHNAQAVADTAVAALYSVDTTIDGDPSDAAHRAAYLLTPTLAVRLGTPPRTGSGVAWQQWSDTHAYITVTTKTIAIPWTVADARSTVVRNVGFIQTVHTATGDTALPQQTLALTLTRTTDNQPWRVESMETP